MSKYNRRYQIINQMLIGLVVKQALRQTPTSGDGNWCQINAVFDNITDRVNTIDIGILEFIDFDFAKLGGFYARYL